MATKPEQHKGKTREKSRKRQQQRKRESRLELFFSYVLKEHHVIQHCSLEAKFSNNWTAKQNILSSASLHKTQSRP